MEDDSVRIENEQDEKERSRFIRWLEKLLSDQNWEYLSQGCINYPYCYF